jgi:hypothetical protein
VAKLRFKVQLVVEDEEAAEQEVVELAVLEKDHERIEQLGLTQNEIATTRAQPTAFGPMLWRMCCSNQVVVKEARRKDLTALACWRITCKYAISGSGPDETRTRDLRHAKAALSQLSYGPGRPRLS